jgi:hypothetical protein
MCCIIPSSLGKYRRSSSRHHGGVGHGAHGGCGGRRGGGNDAQTIAPIVQTASWPEHYKPPYFYTAKQFGTPGKVPYIVDVNAVPLFSEYSLPQLVRVRMADGEQMGARPLFAAIPRSEDPAYDDPGKEMLDIIHDEGEGGGFGYEDGQVEDSDPT